MERREKAGVGP